jgi:hypothetical protein
VALPAVVAVVALSAVVAVVALVAVSAVAAWATDRPEAFWLTTLAAIFLTCLEVRPAAVAVPTVPSVSAATMARTKMDVGRERRRVMTSSLQCLKACGTRLAGGGRVGLALPRGVVLAGSWWRPRTTTLEP